MPPGLRSGLEQETTLYNIFIVTWTITLYFCNYTHLIYEESWGRIFLKLENASGQAGQVWNRRPNCTTPSLILQPLH